MLRLFSDQQSENVLCYAKLIVVLFSLARKEIYILEM